MNAQAATKKKTPARLALLRLARRPIGPLSKPLADRRSSRRSQSTVTAAGKPLRPIASPPRNHSSRFRFRSVPRPIRPQMWLSCACGHRVSLIPASASSARVLTSHPVHVSRHGRSRRRRLRPHKEVREARGGKAQLQTKPPARG